jgi:hypothetical protein
VAGSTSAARCGFCPTGLKLARHCSNVLASRGW